MEAIFIVGLVWVVIAAVTQDRGEQVRVTGRLHKAVRAPIPTLQEGKSATIAGTVTLVDPTHFVIAPLSGERCVFWMVYFDEVGAGDWHRLGRAAGGCDFLVEDSGVSARVVPDGALVDLPGHTFSRRSWLWGSSGTDPVIELALTCCNAPNHPAHTVLRATEHLVVAGASIVVNGVCAREPDPTATEAVTGYREQLPTRPVLSGSKRTPLVIRHDPLLIKTGGRPA